MVNSMACNYCFCLEVANVIVAFGVLCLAVAGSCDLPTQNKVRSCETFTQLRHGPQFALLENLVHGQDAYSWRLSATRVFSSTARPGKAVGK